MTNYIALIHKEPDSSYGVSFPDFQGCITAGDSIDECRVMAEEALQMHIDGMREDGDKIPKPTKFSQLVLDSDEDDDLLCIITVEVE